MDVPTFAQLPSVHPRLFGPLMRPFTNRTPKSIPSECIRPDISTKNITLLDHEPLNFSTVASNTTKISIFFFSSYAMLPVAFLACSHLDVQEECFHGLCETKHERFGSIPKHIKVPVLEKEEILSLDHKQLLQASSNSLLRVFFFLWH